MPQQSVYTKDNMSVFIDTALFYRIIDPYKATYIVKDLVASLVQITFVTLRTICGEYVNILFMKESSRFIAEKNISERKNSIICIKRGKRLGSSH